jgi:hypothetical protein
MKQLLPIIICWLLIFGCAEEKKQPAVINSDKLLGAYYFGAGYFTLVPDNIRHDLDEMKKLGTDFICITATESDITRNTDNITFISKEAHQRGMKVFMVPSRIAGVTAGQPLEPSIYPYHHPETWVVLKDGSKLVRKGMGAMCSFYYPEVKQYFIDIVKKMIDQWEIDGIIWDEPKWTFIGWQDFSEAALKNNPDSSYVKYMQDYALFYSDVNAAIKEHKPDITIVHFDEACRNDTVVEQSAKIKNIDYLGVDGHPYPSEYSTHKGNRSTKVLPVYGERYLKAARENGLKTMMLVENQSLTGDQIKWMDETFPELLNMDVDMLVYYYYGFYSDDTEERMNVIRKHIVNFK